MSRCLSALVVLASFTILGVALAKEGGAPWNPVARALQATSPVDFEEVPLSEAIDFLRRAHRVNIASDANALDNVGLSLDAPVSFHLQHATLAETLTLMLEELDLTWIAPADVILVTTPEEAESMLETKRYPVGDLLHEANRPAAIGKLADIVTANPAPETWSNVGGPGALSESGGALVVTQTQQVHRQVASLLASLRAAMRDK